MNIQAWHTPSPFHEGERILQERVGLRDRMEMMGQRVIRDHMPDQHREFFGKLPFLVLGSVDSKGWPWASIVAGHPGFAETPTARKLRLNAPILVDDPLADALAEGSAIGVVGVELPTRRRNRMNATVSQWDGQHLDLDVVQSFGNCPQYIQTHGVEFIRDPDRDVARPPTEKFDTLDDDARSMISTAHSFFVSSYVRNVAERTARGVDVSHRGGRPGFVKVEGDTLLIPDFSGNNFFNTLGNFVLNPKAGLIFPDFETGTLLFLTGRTEILDDGHPDIAGFLGAERGWRFWLHKGMRIHDALPFRADLQEFSRYSLMADNWESAEARQEAGT